MEVFVVVKARHDVDSGKFELDTICVSANREEAYDKFHEEIEKVKAEFGEFDAESNEGSDSEDLEFQIYEAEWSTANYCTIKLQKKIL